jgi:hypothetical protein
MIIDTKEVLWMMVLKVLNPTEQDRMTGPENAPHVPLDRFPMTTLLRTLFAYLHLAFLKESDNDHETMQTLHITAQDIHQRWRCALDHFTSIRPAVAALPTLWLTTLRQEDCHTWMGTLRHSLRCYAEALFDCQLYTGRFRDGTPRNTVIIFADVLKHENLQDTMKTRRRVTMVLLHAGLAPRKPHLYSKLNQRMQCFITQGNSLGDGLWAFAKSTSGFIDEVAFWNSCKD